jgi:hypothetical protein
MQILKPDSVTDIEWEAIEKAKTILSEHFQNIALFMNWVADNGETKRGEILNGNTFALKHHIESWLDGEFEPDIDEDEEEKEYS